MSRSPIPAPARIPAIGILLLASASLGLAQREDPVQWTLTSDAAQAPPGSRVTLHLTAKLEEGWHLYSLTTPPGGPIPTTVKLDENPAVDAVKIYQPKPARRFDSNFNLGVETFEKEVPLLLDAGLKKDASAGP